MTSARSSSTPNADHFYHQTSLVSRGLFVPNPHADCSTWLPPCWMIRSKKATCLLRPVLVRISSPLQSRPASRPVNPDQPPHHVHQLNLAAVPYVYHTIDIKRDPRDPTRLSKPFLGLSADTGSPCGKKAALRHVKVVNLFEHEVDICPGLRNHRAGVLEI